MDEKNMCKRFHLDNEIRNLLLFAFDEYGEEGVQYVQAEIETIIGGLKAGKLIAEKQ